MPRSSNSYHLLTDKCAPNNKYLCLNGGTCQMNSSVNVECICQEKYYGDLCQKGLSTLQYSSSIKFLLISTFYFNRAILLYI